MATPPFGRVHHLHKKQQQIDATAIFQELAFLLSKLFSEVQFFFIFFYKRSTAWIVPLYNLYKL